jgi:excisionase family DNA binding protein
MAEFDLGEKLDAYRALLADGVMRPREAWTFLGVSRSQLYRLFAEGLLPYVSYGRARRVPRRALIEFAARHMVPARD